MGDTLFTATWIFVLGSVGGVLLELAWMRILEGSRAQDSRSGLLYLPVNPLYGGAAVIGSLLLAPLAASPALVFLAGVVIFTALEWLASLVLERTFGVVFWDYSDKPANVGGRICLEYALLWGILGMALVYLLDPALRALVQMIPRLLGEILVIVILGAVAFATVLTLAGFARLRSVIAGWTPATSVAAQPQWQWDGLIDRFAAPGAVAANFPQMNLSVRYRRLRRTPRRRSLAPRSR